MKVLFSKHHNKHIPKYEIFNGIETPHAEVPMRVVNILSELKREHELIDLSNEVMSLKDLPHAGEYIKFLQQPFKDYTYPSVFGYEIGKYSSDMYTPMGENTYKAALSAATLAYKAAELISKNKEQIVYVLCRPPGHHAGHKFMGGYCYFNNSAVAADYLSKTGKVAVLDVDFHHGNGTQDIFYDRNDVFTVSIHAANKFPFTTGFNTEKGKGKGIGFNLNYRLPLGTTNNEYNKILKQAILKIKKFNPKYLVIPFGADTHEADPIGGFKLTTDYYEKMGRMINSLRLPIVVVQEGGYNTSLLGKNVASFLRGFRES